MLAFCVDNAACQRLVFATVPQKTFRCTTGGDQGVKVIGGDVDRRSEEQYGSSKPEPRSLFPWRSKRHQAQIHEIASWRCTAAERIGLSSIAECPGFPTN